MLANDVNVKNNRYFFFLLVLRVGQSQSSAYVDVFFQQM